jgi:hypothetical protein
LVEAEVFKIGPDKLKIAAWLGSHRSVFLRLRPKFRSSEVQKGLSGIERMYG